MCVGSGLRRKLAELEKQAEPVLHVPRSRQASSVDRMKLVQAEAHPLASRRDAEEFTPVCTCDLGTHADPAGLLDHVVDSDLNVRKGAPEAADDRLDAFGSGALA